MDHKEVILKVLNHQINFIEKQVPEFSNLPICPFAKKARTDGKIDFFVHDLEDKTAIYYHLERPFKETLYCIHPNLNLTVEKLDKITEEFESKYNKNDLVFFALHPEHPYKLGGIYTRRTPYPCMLIQKSSFVDEKEIKLRNTHYYDKLNGENIVFIKNTNKNLGTFASIGIPKGTIISELTGPIEDVEKLTPVAFQISEKLQMNSELIAKINHSCDPNCEIIFNNNGIILVAIKNIPPLYELTFDYETTEEDLICYNCHFDCLCNSQNCRKKIRGFFYTGVKPNWKK